MTINFEKLISLEKKYINNTIAYNTLQKMVDIVTDRIPIVSISEDSSYLISVETLISLGVINETPQVNNKPD